MILKFGEPVNIIYASMQDIDDSAVGQMVIRMPADDDKASEMIKYLKKNELKIEEVRE